jgi:hypothetical protein
VVAGVVLGQLALAEQVVVGTELMIRKLEQVEQQIQVAVVAVALILNQVVRVVQELLSLKYLVYTQLQHQLD